MAPENKAVNKYKARTRRNEHKMITLTFSVTYPRAKFISSKSEKIEKPRIIKNS